MHNLAQLFSFLPGRDYGSGRLSDGEGQVGCVSDGVADVGVAAVVGVGSQDSENLGPGRNVLPHRRRVDGLRKA